MRIYTKKGDTGTTGLLFGGARGREYREAARWLASAPVPALLERER